MPVALDDLRTRLNAGLLAFPATAFTPDLSLDEERYRGLFRELAAIEPAAIFPAAGAGELFSLTQTEHEAVVRASVAEAGGIPVLAGVGGGVGLAVELARQSERSGSDGLLLCPPYLVGGEQEGLAAYVEAVCRSVEIGVVIYNRDQLQLLPDTLARLAGRCSNLIGLKDGVGDLEMLLGCRLLLGDRLAFINGLPTAEIAASAYAAIGVRSYSSAVLNFAPRTARRFYEAVETQDRASVERMLTDLYLPIGQLRRSGRGYAVSIIKAGLKVMGRSAGPVRPPLIELKPDEQARLRSLLAEHAKADSIELPDGQSGGMRRND